MAEPQYQRSKKNILIIPGFQGRMILFVLLTGSICMILNGYLYYSYVADSYAFILKHSTLPQELAAQRYRDLLVFGLSLAAATLVATLIFAVWALFVTHRAAGSVYQIRRVIEEIKAGNVNQRVHLRENDEFQDVAKSFNEMVDVLQKR